MNEIWDITDAEGRPTGLTMEKGAPMRPGEYHLSVSVWIVNDSGEFLISRRVPGKKAAPGMWEAAGGSALAGEDALTAALREVKEELGLVLDPAKGHVFSRYTWPHSDGSGAACIVVWIFRQEAALSGLSLQREETCGAKWASKEQLRALIRDGKMIPYTYIEELFRHTERMEQNVP